jgi:hypothetical protein
MVRAADLIQAGQRRRQQFRSRQALNSGNHRSHTVRPFRVPGPRVVPQAVIVVENQGFHGIR